MNEPFDCTRPVEHAACARPRADHARRHPRWTRPTLTRADHGWIAAVVIYVGTVLTLAALDALGWW